MTRRTIVETVEAGEPMICPRCRKDDHHYHRVDEQDLPQTEWDGPTPEVGACWGWDRLSNSLCLCEWRRPALH